MAIERVFLAMKHGDFPSRDTYRHLFGILISHSRNDVVNMMKKTYNVWKLYTLYFIHVNMQVIFWSYIGDSLLFEVRKTM